MEDNTKCRLLELPAELRIRIYEYCLAPTGTLCLTATKTTRYATTPTLAPKLLCTCRQIYTEAQDLLHEQNRVCFSIDAFVNPGQRGTQHRGRSVVAETLKPVPTFFFKHSLIAVCRHDTSWPVISEKRLPQHALERLEHAAIILDAATTFYSSYRYIDWSALSALVSLKSLQLSIVWQKEASNIGPASWLDFYDLLEEVLERIPQSTAVTFGTKEGTPERVLLRSVAEKRQRGRSGAEVRTIGLGNAPVTVQELTAAEYEELADIVGEINQGAQSGGVDDVFGEYREGRMKTFSRARVEPMSQTGQTG